MGMTAFSHAMQSIPPAARAAGYFGAGIGVAVGADALFSREQGSNAAVAAAAVGYVGYNATSEVVRHVHRWRVDALERIHPVTIAKPNLAKLGGARLAISGVGMLVGMGLIDSFSHPAPAAS